MKAASRRAVVAHLQRHHGLSQRGACASVGIGRTTVRRKLLRPELDRSLKQELRALVEHYPRYGYLMLYGLLRARKLVKNRKRTYRLYRSSAFGRARSAGKSCIAPVFRCLSWSSRTSTGHSTSCTTSLVMGDASAS